MTGNNGFSVSFWLAIMIAAAVIAVLLLIIVGLLVYGDALRKMKPRHRTILKRILVIVVLLLVTLGFAWYYQLFSQFFIIAGLVGLYFSLSKGLAAGNRRPLGTISVAVLIFGLWGLLSGLI